MLPHSLHRSALIGITHSQAPNTSAILELRLTIISGSSCPIVRSRYLLASKLSHEVARLNEMEKIKRYGALGLQLVTLFALIFIVTNPTNAFAQTTCQRQCSRQVQQCSQACIDNPDPPADCFDVCNAQGAACQAGCPSLSMAKLRSNEQIDNSFSLKSASYRQMSQKRKMTAPDARWLQENIKRLRVLY
jgi:hypothetical protein